MEVIRCFVSAAIDIVAVHVLVQAWSHSIRIVGRIQCGENWNYRLNGEIYSIVCISSDQQTSWKLNWYGCSRWWIRTCKHNHVIYILRNGTRKRPPILCVPNSKIHFYKHIFRAWILSLFVRPSVIRKSMTVFRVVGTALICWIIIIRRLYHQIMY